MRRFDVYGVGNALVDLEYHVAVEDLESLSIPKGLMTLVDQERQAVLVSGLGERECNRGSGGSAANTIIALSQLGGRAYFSGRVAGDELGKFYVDDLIRAGVQTNAGASSGVRGVTGKCLVLVTPDADRTMNTFLGASAELSPTDIDREAIRESQYVYLEGYLVTGDCTLAAVKAVQEKARQCGTRIALSLSDPNIVNYFRGPIDELVSGGVDLLFANEEEAKCLARAESLDDAILFLKKVAREFAVTCGPHGALVYDGRVLHRIPPVPTQAVDTLGAGDMFAGAFLYGITHGMPHAQAGALASAASSLLVANWGPRLKAEQTQGVLQQHLAQSIPNAARSS